MQKIIGIFQSCFHMICKFIYCNFYCHTFINYIYQEYASIIFAFGFLDFLYWPNQWFLLVLKIRIIPRSLRGYSSFIISELFLHAVFSIYFLFIISNIHIPLPTSLIVEYSFGFVQLCKILVFKIILMVEYF